MKLGIANEETWIFLENIFEYLSSQYQTEVFKPMRWPLSIWEQKISHYLLRRNLRNFIHRNDVVLFEWASELLVEASQLHTNLAAAIVVRLHRYEMFQWVQRINWNTVSYVILDTEAMRKKLIEKTNIDTKRAVVLPNAVPLDKTSVASRPFRGKIGILANLIPRKRIYELILAYYSLQKEIPWLTLHIGGAERPLHRDYYEAIKDLIRRLGIGEKVTFDGYVNDRWDWYQQIDIFVSYSYSEGMQVSPIEAAASGCYCLSHWWEGADEIFTKEQIFLTETEFINKARDYIYVDEINKQQMRQPFIEYVQKFCDLTKINKEIQNIIEKAYTERLAQ
jgi:glycosyltransferase involved in cell wall biosynthesis